MNRFRTPITFLVLALAVWAGGCNADTEPAPGLPGGAALASDRSVAQAIDAMWSAHIAAAQQKELLAVMDIYAPEAVFVVPGSTDVRGHEGIEAMEQAGMLSTDVLDVRHTTRGLNVVGDGAYEVGTVVGPLRVGDAEPAIVVFHFMAHWKRQADDAWRIEYFVGQPE